MTLKPKLFLENTKNLYVDHFSIQKQPEGLLSLKSKYILDVSGLLRSGPHPPNLRMKTNSYQEDNNKVVCLENT